MGTGLRPCFGCGAPVPDEEGPTHRYLGASPGCWRLYGEVLGREYADYPRFAPVHRLTVDAYAAQHPGTPSPQSVGSVAAHLIRLHLQLECGLPHDRANDAMLGISSRSKEDFVWLDPPDDLGDVTVLDVLEARDPEEHMERVRGWAASVWEAWAPHHETVRRWAVGEGYPKIARGR
jgi:hypothetical protein